MYNKEVKLYWSQTFKTPKKWKYEFYGDTWHILAKEGGLSPWVPVGTVGRGSTEDEVIRAVTAYFDTVIQNRMTPVITKTFSIKR